MKRIATLAIILPLLSTACFAADEVDGEYRLVWADEFDVDGKPNPKHWTYEDGFVRNNELQWYQPQNAICKDGVLIIWAEVSSHRQAE